MFGEHLCWKKIPCVGSDIIIGLVPLYEPVNAD